MQPDVNSKNIFLHPQIANYVASTAASSPPNISDRSTSVQDNPESCCALSVVQSLRVFTVNRHPVRATEFQLFPRKSISQFNALQWNWITISNVPVCLSSRGYPNGGRKILKIDKIFMNCICSVHSTHSTHGTWALRILYSFWCFERSRMPAPLQSHTFYSFIYEEKDMCVPVADPDSNSSSPRNEMVLFF